MNPKPGKLSSKSKGLLRTAAALGLIIFFYACAPGDKDSTGKEECVPVPDDTSALARKKHFIPKADIDAFEKSYAGARDSLMGKSGLFVPEAEAFNKPAILQILKDPKCVGIKIYYGVKQGDRNNELRLIIVGVDSQGNDLYITDSGTSALAAQGGGGGFGGNEYGQCTPPCPGDSLPN